MTDCCSDRREFLRAAMGGLAVLGGGLLPAAASAATPSAPEMTPAQGLQRLMAGNARFVSGQSRAAGALVQRRADVAGKQKPYAMILACADSRVPPEHVFDEAVGDLFVCRVAGNISEPTTVGSFEYAFAMFGTPVVLIVMGHQRCGAVVDSIALTKSGEKAPGSIGSIVEKIQPSIKAVKQGSMSDAAYAEAVVRANAKYVATDLLDDSSILKGAVKDGKLLVVPAYYSLDSGKIQQLS